MKKAPTISNFSVVTGSKSDKLKNNGFTITVTYLDEPAETVHVRASSTALV